MATPPAPLAAPAPRKPAETRLSKAEYERRVSLHQKFGEEIATLAAAQVHLIVFQVGEEFFAIEISKVREVVRTPAVTRIPNSPAYIAGMASIRGEAIVIMDLGKKLQVASATSAEMAFTLVVETEHYTIGILVANVPQSRIVDGDMIQPTQDSISQTTTDETYIKGLVRFPAELVFFLDIDELIEGDRLRARVVAE